MQRVGERLQEVGVDGRRQVLGLLGVEVHAAAEMSRDRPGQVRQLAGQARGEDRPEDRHAEGAADRAEEGRGRRGDPDLLRPDVVLDDEDEHLHDEADPDPDDQHVERGQPGCGADAEPREQVHAADEHGRARDRERLVAADAADRPARGDSGDEQAGHQRQQAQTRARRAGAVDELQVERDEDDRPEHRHPDREAHRVRDPEDTRAEQLQRQDRLFDARLPPEEHGEQRHSDDGEPDDRRRAPGVLVAAPGREQDQRGDAAAQERGAEEIELVAHRRRVEVQSASRRSGSRRLRPAGSRRRPSARRGCRRGSRRAAGRRPTRPRRPSRSAPCSGPARAAGRCRR